MCTILTKYWGHLAIITKGKYVWEDILYSKRLNDSVGFFLVSIQLEEHFWSHSYSEVVESGFFCMKFVQANFYGVCFVNWEQKCPFQNCSHNVGKIEACKTHKDHRCLRRRKASLHICIFFLERCGKKFPRSCWRSPIHLKVQRYAVHSRPCSLFERFYPSVVPITVYCQ